MTTTTTTPNLHHLILQSQPQHPYTNNATVQHKPKPRKKPESIPQSRPGTIPPCTECGKLFSSWKALFGHMRCHPERQWRGINPPVHFRQCGAQFTSVEYEVASSLILLANGPKQPKFHNRLPGPKSVGGYASAHHHHHHLHECGVCFRGFSSGQALGGHMKCHSLSFMMGSVVKCLDLDLNLPPPLEGIEGSDTGLDLRLGM